MIVGLEVHCELNTKTKIYCSCRNSFGAEVNSQCCPVCMGMPGTLPTLNEKVVDYAVKMGYLVKAFINLNEDAAIKRLQFQVRFADVIKILFRGHLHHPFRRPAARRVAGSARRQCDRR